MPTYTTGRYSLTVMAGTRYRVISGDNVFHLLVNTHIDTQTRVNRYYKNIIRIPNNCILRNTNDQQNHEVFARFSTNS